MYTNSSDCYFYVVGSSDSNELILGTVLDTLLDSVGTLLKESIDKHSLLNNLELILLVMDEIIDNGIIFELDPYKVANRVLMIVRSLSLIFFVSCVCVCVCDFFCFTLNHHPTITWDFCEGYVRASGDLKGLAYDVRSVDLHLDYASGKQIAPM